MNQQYCQDQAKSLGGMDAGVNNWCTNNSNNSFCTCYNAVYNSTTEGLDPQEKLLLARPECYVSSCSSGVGYKYDSMKPPSSGSCPNVNYCANKMTIVGNTDLNLSGVTQSCNQSITATSGSTPAQTAAPAPTISLASTSVAQDTSPSTADQIKKFFATGFNFYYFIFIVILILFGFGFALLDNDTTEADDKDISDYIEYKHRHATMPSAPPALSRATSLSLLPSAPPADDSWF